MLLGPKCIDILSNYMYVCILDWIYKICHECTIINYVNLSVLHAYLDRALIILLAEIQPQLTYLNDTGGSHVATMKNLTVLLH